MKPNLSNLIWAVLLLLMSSCAYTPRIRGPGGQALPGSIATMEWAEIGGIRQSFLIRGNDTANPVLIYIHGGPGKGEMPLISSYNRALEEHFTVVTWDQRGAGRSNRLFRPVRDFSLESYLTDVHEATQYALSRLNKEKAFLMGHSWGAMLGIQVVYRHPDDYYAFVAIGQPVGMWENIVLAYRKALAFAHETGNRKVIRKLEKSGIDGSNLKDCPRRDITYVRKFINSHTPNRIDNGIYGRLVWRSIWSTEYSWPDVARYLLGVSSAMGFLNQNDIETIDMYKLVPELKVPYVIIAGIQDVFTDLDLTRAYFDFVKAPYKAFHVFEQSTHHPPYEEPQKFNQILIREVRPVGLGLEPILF
ncbi:MAG: alpha/beta hydrolase [Bacteroidales bacterium]